MRVIQIKNQINIFYLKNIPELFKDRFIYDSLDTNKILILYILNIFYIH